MGIDEAHRHMGNRSPWEVLGVPVNAAWAKVVSAFRALLLTVHPDRCAVHGLSEEDATKRSRILIAAFTMLKARYGK